MPSIFAHYLCGAKTIEILRDGALKELILNNRQVFNLGTQGPDIFFYYRVWPWTDSHGINEIGERMHDEKVMRTFSSFLEYVKNRTGADKSLLTAYLCGYACHHALDLNTHPYIFYKTGFVREGEAYTPKYSTFHRMFETALDVLMLDLLLNKKPASMNVSKLIRVNNRESGSIGSMYETILKEVHGITLISEQVEMAIRDMTLVQVVLRDKTGLKKKLLSWTEAKLGMFPLMSSMIHPAGITDGLDYLNLKHAQWALPWDDSIRHSSSFVEMFENAVQEASELCTAIRDYLSGEIDKEHALGRLGNRSFSTGVDCEADTEFKYYDIIFT